MIVAANVISVIARSTIALASQTMLRLLRSTVALTEFVKLGIEAVLKLFDAAIQVPYTLHQLLRKPRGLFGLEESHRRMITPVCA